MLDGVPVSRRHWVSSLLKLAYAPWPVAIPEVWLVAGLGTGFMRQSRPVRGGLCTRCCGVVVRAGVDAHWLDPARDRGRLDGRVCILADGAAGLPMRYGVADDAPEIVVDEIAGIWLALLMPHPKALWALVAGFALFRLFDITRSRPPSVGPNAAVPGARQGVIARRPGRRRDGAYCDAVLSSG